jgi:pyruvate ferredoxin oxidoreductase delta subunit
MATPDHLLKDWDGFLSGGVLYSFDTDAKTRDFAWTNSYNYPVADWRVKKPVFNPDFCVHCQFCWVYCPDTSIISKDKKFDHVDLAHCKGCGICAEVCPTNPKSLLMFMDTVHDEEALASWPAKEDKKTAEGE